MEEQQPKMEQHIETQNYIYGKGCVIVSGGSPVIHIHNDGKNTNCEPEELPVALKEALEKFRNAGYLDEGLQPIEKLSHSDAAVMASVIAGKLWNENRWKVFEKLWDIPHLSSYYNKALNQKKTVAMMDNFHSILKKN